MAGKDSQRRHHLLRHCSFTGSLCRTLPPLLFTCIAYWFFCFLLHRSKYFSSSSPEVLGVLQTSNSSSTFDHLLSNVAPLSHDWPPLGEAHCDLASGRWVRDEFRKQTYDENCRDIFKGWNCLRNNKSNARDILAWRWQPWECDLPQLDAKFFLERFKHRRIGFVGDSLNRNMYVSLVCYLKQASGQVKKWRPVGADKGVTFLDYNLTLAYHRTNLLARYRRWEAKEGGQLKNLGYREGYRVDVDVPQSTWAEAPRFHDVLILNTGHWWQAPVKFDPAKSPMLFFEGGDPVIPTRSPVEGLDMVLKNMLKFVDKEMRMKGMRFLRTQSPRHFEGGDWNEGGKCDRVKPLDTDEVEAFFSLDNHGPNVEMNIINEHLTEAVRGTSFLLLNISYMTSFRADGHPSKSAGKLHEDCMHWCLPGVTDIWNDMFALHLLRHSQEISS